MKTSRFERTVKLLKILQVKVLQEEAVVACVAMRGYAGAPAWTMRREAGRLGATFPAGYVASYACSVQGPPGDQVALNILFEDNALSTGPRKARRAAATSSIDFGVT